MKKLLCVLLTAAMLLGILSGCGSTPSAESSDSTPTPVAQTESPSDVSALEGSNSEETLSVVEQSSVEESAVFVMEPVALPLTAEPVEVSFWTSLDPRIVDYLPDSNVEDALWAYRAIAEKTGVKIHLDTVSAFSQNEQFQLMVAGGDYDDILYNVQGLYSTGYSGAIQDGVILDIRDMLEEQAPNVFNTIMNSDELRASLVDENDQIGVIPMLYKEGGLEVADIVYRSDWAEEFGIGRIESVEDYHDYLLQAKEVYHAPAYANNANSLGGGNNGALDSFVCQAMGAYDSYYQIDGEVIYGPVQDAYYEYLTEMSKWWAEGLYPDDAMTVGMTEQQQSFGVGTHASTICNGSAGISELYAYGKNPDGTNSIEVWALGKMTYQDENRWLVSEKNSIQKDAVWSLSVDCTEPELLCQLANWLYTEEGSLAACRGVEGETYTLDENGDPQWTDLIVNNPDGYSTTVTFNLYATANVPCMFDQRRTFIGFDDVQLELVDVFKGEDVNRNNIPRQATSNFWSEDEQTEYSDVQSDISTYRDEMEWSFIMGKTELNEETWNSYVDTLYEMGLQTVIDLYQAAYDRYSARLNSL